MRNNEFNQNKRWYDEDPTVSLATSFIRNSSPDQHDKIAEKIIETAKAHGIESDTDKIVFNRRWYDENKNLRLAMEYLKDSPNEVRKIIALDIINFLTEIKA